MLKKIVFIGSGNVATSLAVALHEDGKNILQVYSKTLENARLLAVKVKAGFTDIAGDIRKDADLYIIAVPDNQIASIVASVDFGDKLVVHTSGTTSIDVFKNHVKNYGVLYPLQTFSKSRIIDDFTHTPVFVEGATDEIQQTLYALARELSEQVHFLSSEQRVALHISAVFACNFVNHMFALATDVMQQNGLNKEWLRPLVEETISKALSSYHPGEVQTGPASRSDNLTIDKHFDYLIKTPELQTVYAALTNSILMYVSSQQNRYEK